MTKIDPVLNGEFGIQSRTKINEAMKTVEHDATLTGDGTLSDPLAIDLNNVQLDEFEKLRLIPSSTVELTQEGEIKWCDNFYTPKYNTGLGVTIQVGINEYYVFYNDTGAIIPSGKMMHLLSGTLIGGQLYPTFEYADPRTWEKVQGTLGMTMHEVPVDSLGILSKSAQLVPADTSGVSAGSQLWIAADGSGDFTDIIPQFPNIPISIGGSYDSAIDGSVFFNITSGINEIFDNGWDGSIIETFDFLVTSDGVTITGTLTNDDNTRDLPIRFSTGLHTFDTTTAPATIVLTEGTDGQTQPNYVYIPESTKVLTVSASDWPVAEHAKVAVINAQSAATLAIEGGAEGNQNINDHIKTTGDNGHILHMADWIRSQPATHISGVEGSLTGTPTNGYVQITGGKIRQMHPQDANVFSMPTQNILIANDFTTPNRRTNNLNTINAYSDGSSWNNEWSKVVVWYVCNKSGEVDFAKLNLPTGGYNSEQNAIDDALNKAVYTIPEDFTSKAILIASFVVRIGGGTITYNGGNAYNDLRKFTPNAIIGGIAGGGGGVTTWLALTDTDSTFAGKAGALSTVNAGETKLELLHNLFAKINFDAGLCVDTLQTFLPENGVCFGDGDTGFIESSDDILQVITAGIFRVTISSAGVQPRTSVLPFTTNVYNLGRSDKLWNNLYVNTIDVPQLKISGQVTPGDHTETFNTTPTFDFNNGNVQEMTVTANVTSWTISNELPAGSYTIYFIQDGTGGWTIADPTGIDKEANESLAAFDTIANAINIVNVFVTSGGVSIWSLVGTA